MNIYTQRSLTSQFRQSICGSSFTLDFLINFYIQTYLRCLSAVLLSVNLVASEDSDRVQISGPGMGGNFKKISRKRETKYRVRQKTENIKAKNTKKQKISKLPYKLIILPKDPLFQ